MRLNSIEIKGFKSFGNPTILYFDENVTGVVGPNGSGKSNVVDAFRWVLGEQKSKELRLEQMGDILFNGSLNKKQANMAEVSITFDNTKNILPIEFNNVKITRTLYRNGDSEYRINEIICRLKDIQTLLLDTGIGSNSYSIIELGMVDDILHDKEDARRRMFEQAAGISKFKKRKKETLQKLSLTNSDLERVEDLLFEIENNLKDLEKQAKRTKKYFEIKSAYKEESLSLYKIRWKGIELSANNISHQIDLSIVEYNEHLVLQNALEARLEIEKLKNLKEEKELSEFQKSLNLLLDSIRQLENEKNLVNQKIAFSKNYIEKAEVDISKTEPLLLETQNRKISLQEQLAQKEKDYKHANVKLADCQLSLDAIHLDFSKNKNFQELKYNELQILKNQIFEIDKQLAVIQNRKEACTREKTNNLNQIEQIQKGTFGQKTEQEHLHKKIKIFENEIFSLTQKERHRIASIERIESEISILRDSCSKLNRNIDALENEKNLLVSMVENLEGFPESVKFLHAKWTSKKIMLSDVINTEDKFRAAVEQFLQPYLNYFIVENTKEAENAIELLKNSQKGKAQFFILDRIKYVEHTSEIGLSPLTDIIEVEDRYSDLIHLICHNVFMVSEQRFYEDQLFENHPEITLLDTNGSLLRNKTQISGGSIGLFEGKKIGRKKRIDHLNKAILKEKSVFGNETQKLNILLEELKNLKNARFDAEIKNKEREKSNIEKLELIIKSKLESADSNILKFTERNKDLEVIELDLNEKIEKDFKDKKHIAEKVQLLNESISNQNIEIESLNQKLSEARDAFNKQNIYLIQTENHLLSIKKDIDYQNDRMNELNQNKYDSKNILDVQIKELETSNLQLKETIVLLENKYNQKNKQQAFLGSAEQDYFKARAVLSEIEDEIKKVTKIINEKQFLINQLKDKLNDFKFSKNSIKERLNIEFGVEIEELLNAELPSGRTETEIEIEVEKYKRRLDNYGEINPLALEAYNEMQTRFFHIKAQRDDINEAKISLLSTIKEIEDTATKLFLESFDQVRKHFVVVFRSLFTIDDDCDLILESPNDPLNSKIEIIAKPKGKRPKSLSQLSGGEKTLTATALLFSLYLLKPAPFCIFDEVDAPLDDINIQKFANIIRTFSDKSQFIIVTHNKSTMAEVDVLYGVYMQQKGISGVSAVDFRNYEEKGTLHNSTLSTI